MLNIVCVKWGTKYGAEYVNILRDMTLRNLPDGLAGKFICFTDDLAGIDPSISVRPLPGHLSGWWNKVWLFRKRVFDRGERVIYFDLDTVITGPLDDLVSYSGDFGVLRDFYFNEFGSSLMSWRVSEETENIYAEYERQGFPQIGGDQEWIGSVVERYDYLQNLFPGQFYSYKQSGRTGIPAGARAIAFHGEPKPHEAGDWVPHVWKIGGGTSASLIVQANVPHETITANIRAAKARENVGWLTSRDAHDGTALICAGGPSLNDELPSIMAHKSSSASLFSVNGTIRFLAGNKITSDYHVILDARPENVEFVRIGSPAQRLYSSQCHPLVQAYADCFWHPYFDGILDITGPDDQSAYVGGGTTAGLKAIVIAYILGYRKIHLYGFDSSYRGDENHAYPQPMNSSERILEVPFGDKVFRCAPWMAVQAEDFRGLIPDLISKGCEFYVHGDGLIPAIAGEMVINPELTAPDIRAMTILKRLNGHSPVYGAEIGVFGADLSSRLLAQREDLTLKMVDPWAVYENNPASDDFHSKLSQVQQDDYAEMARFMTSFAGGRAQIIRLKSVEAAKVVPDDSLDFVFIDAEHSYEACKADIEAWYPKVRPGGFIGGHDYANAEYSFGETVKRAVDEMIPALGLTLELDANYTWFARKTENA